ncbi:MAG: carbohydrate ABC transporter permease [Acidimicrobiales bacterium]
MAIAPPGARQPPPSGPSQAPAGRGVLFRPRTTNAAKRGAGRRPLALPYLFVAPAVFLTAVFSLLPLGMLVWRSLFGGGVFATSLSFVGLQNYSDALAQGGTNALKVTGIYTAAFVVATMAFGLGVALLLDVKLPGVRHLRAPFIIPLVLPPVATALIWGNLFAPQFGFINRGLGFFGLHQADFTSSPSLALLTVLTFGIWQFFGENVILYLAALKTLPLDVIEAAAVDGAGPWLRFRHIRWPLLRRSTVLIWVITTLTGLQTFTQIFILTNGGPNGGTTTALYYIFNQGFVQFNTGQADAMGVILFGISLAITVTQVGLFGKGARQGD